jgi:Inward rectifier potassium channel C-terminal domain
VGLDLREIQLDLVPLLPFLWKRVQPVCLDYSARTLAIHAVSSRFTGFISVGYTLPNFTNAFFENNCPELQVVMYFQMVWSMMCNAFLFAFFYARLAKCDSRGAQVVFSKTAIVSVVEGQVRFQVRVYDVDAANPVIEAHIRMYAVTKDRPVPRQLRMLQPNDEFGAMLFLSVPSVVSHHIDIYSMLHPPTATPVNPSGIVLRQADSAICNREEVNCPICGESYGTFERWRKHVKFQRIVEGKEGYSREGTHLSLDKADFEPAGPEKYSATLNVEELKEHFASEISEVICVVEGIEPMISGTFVSLQSYRLEDIVFQSGARFKPCVESILSENSNDSFIRVDLDRFHGIDIEDAPERLRSRVGQRSMRAHDFFFFSDDDKSKPSARQVSTHPMP